jgi:hypothetical protein
MRKWTSLILTILIAFQSVVAMADAHQSHQSGSDHVEFEHNHSAELEVSVNDAEEELVAELVGQFDCHHCCHCHGMSPVFLAAQSFGLALPWLNRTGSGYFVEYPSVSIPPGLRPPIA